MELASRLRDTTLGDLLAALHRARADGVLELLEPAGRHAIHLRRGFVQAVESDARHARLGEVLHRSLGVSRAILERARLWAHGRGMRLGQALLAQQVLTHADLDEALSSQQKLRLEGLYALRDAEVRFRVARPLPPGASERSPMSPRETFHGAPRKLPREAKGSAGRRPPPRAASVRVRAPTEQQRALRELGLPEGASEAEARARYRELVLALHPDRAVESTEAERKHRAERLQSVLAAWRALNADA